MLIMKDNWRRRALFAFVFVTSFYSSNGCWMEGVDIWALQVGTRVLDVHRGDIFNRATRDIEGIISESFFDALNGGPYVTVTHSDDRFIIATNDAFQYYEEYETEQQMSVTVNFRCTGGSTGILVFVIEVEDTNNNPPQFVPSNDLTYTIYTPTPPGTTITGCLGGITVRDIDLTTQRIDFTIEENPYFEIEYDAISSTTAKEFIGIIKTTTFIRSLPEPITLTITATDVDLTDDLPLTTSTTITIVADTEFAFPEEVVFAQAFYLATYTNDNQLILSEFISLQRGYDELVHFSLEGEYSENFALIANNNQVTITVQTPLPSTVLREYQIFLIVRVDREYTSGDTATVIIQLPEEVPLEFERAHYEGTIEDNVLLVPQLTLTRGYEGEAVYVEIFGEYASFFAANIQGNTITLSMVTLPDINANNVISLEIVASTEFSSTRSIVTLEIIKDDYVTPVFNRPMYTGSYNTETGLTLEQIVFDQGYDETVQLSLEGEHANLFTITQQGLTVSLTTAGIPPATFSQQRILLTLQASKPRTVGANAAIIITLPAARQLSFEDSTYRGTLQENSLSLEPIVLSTGYDENVAFSLSGDLALFFTYTVVQNVVTINLVTPIPESIIQENNLIILTVEASGLNAISATTSVLVDIIKEDITTPVFSRYIYYGTYQTTSGLNIENINLVQGYGQDVTFEIQGDYKDYFSIASVNNNIVVSVTNIIPEDIIFNEKVFVLNIVASKPLTVGANAAIVIRFPPELTDLAVMRFSQNTYKAEIENNNLRVEDIVLSEGYQTDTEFILSGDYSSYFILTNTNNAVVLSLFNPLPDDEINTFIVLEIEARRERAISTWTSIVVDVIKPEISPLVFSRTYYQGVYSEEMETLSVELISLAQGYDDTVVFQLEGDLASLFTLTLTSSNSLIVNTLNPLPSAVIEQYNHVLFAIVARKPNVIDARSAISIDIDKVTPTQLRFSQDYYMGAIEDNSMTLDPISLEGYSDGVEYTLLGDYSNYFQITTQGSITTLQLLTALPAEYIENNNVLIYTLEAKIEERRSHTTIILEIIKQKHALAFEEIFYVGSYSAAEGLIFNAPMRLSDDVSIPVTYSLYGSQAEWFEIVQTENGIYLIETDAIPTLVLENNNQLVFAIKADSPGLNTATATIVISILKEYTSDTVLGFDQVTYVGTVQNTIVTLDPITLIQGYTQAVSFNLQGDLSSYFTLSVQGAGVVSLTLPTAIPDQLIPANRLIVLEIQASAPQTVPAYATIVFEVIVADDQPSVPQLVFDATYYTGSYTAATGLTMNSPITLTEGYDASVVFALEGDQSQWFGIVQNGNSVSLVLSQSIPPAVLLTNSQLVFVITAQRLGTDTTRATIVISLTDEYTSDTVLGFDQVTYVGTVQNTIVTLDPITLIQGYTQAVSFNLQGDLSSYFTLSVQGAGVVSLTLPTAIPDQLIPANRLIVLEIQASAPHTVPAYATIVFEVIVADDQPSVPQLVFDATYYTGSYTAATGLTMNSPITLTEGYDASVVFALEGDQSQWFGIVQNGNSVSLVLSQSIPPAVLLTNSQLVFVITAQRLGTDTTRATIVISLTDEYTSDTVLGFDQVTYVGTVQNTIVTLDPITLIQGYTQAVSFNLQGDLSSYFTLSVQGAGVVSLTLPTAIPDQLIPANRLIVLEIQASAPQTVPAYATIVFEVIVADDQPSVPQLVFDATYYTGSYTAATGLTMNSPITLTEGYDASVVFALEGDQSQWFGIVQNGNSVSLVLSQSIPPAVLLTNSQLVFVITAQRLGTDTTRATIVISLTDEYTSDTVLGFDQVTYVGTVQNTIVTLDPITLIQGYTQAVSFNLQGDLSSYFTLSVQGAGVVSLTLPTAIPDQLIPANRLIVLEIQASAPQTVPAYATIVFEVIVADDQPSVPQLVFDATYYTGSYTAATGLTMNSPITLTEGYDASVVFALEGDQSQWFGIVQNGNSVSLILSQSIPPAVLLTNSQLVFVITAQQLGTDTTRATIVISLTDEYTSDTVLGFDQVTYVGTVQNTIVTLDPITLIQGYTQAVSFNLQGDLSSYFTLSVQGAGVVSLTLPTAIPDQLIPANRLIVLEIQASAPHTVPAYATIVFEVIVADDQPSVPQLVFDATYYTGSYTAATGLTMNSPITLTEGYDASVVFALEGDQSQWFGIVQNGNSVSLVLSQSIPPAVLLTNSQLVFVITAQRLGTDTTRATIVISLTDEYTSDTVLGFDQVTYVGTVQNTIVTLDPITLIQGYTQAVSFNLQGDLSSYFTLSVQGAGVVSLTLPTAIPDQLIPANRLIVLEIQASAPQTVPAYATIVFEVIVADDQPSVPQLVFDATYYTGSYTAATGLTMNSPITLTEGYDASVVFALEGDQSQWFGIVQNGNSVSLVLSQSIPPAVLLTNSQLVFVITAQRLGTDTTRATIVISLTDEYTSDTVLGFDQVTYVGTVQNTIVTLDPITLIQGYTQAVSFNLQGDLSSYFTLSVQGAGVVSLTLPTAIPDQLIPANRLIVLEIQASAPQTVPAYATIVFEVIVADDQPSVPQLVFDATYYTGSYTAATGLTMNSPITLTEGYDASVVFALEGDQSQWFGIVQNGNSVSLILSQSIPPAVLLTNSQLVFVITAQRLGTDTTRATIVISLTDEYTSDTVLGFDQVTYVGTVQNTIVTLDPITLIQGYTQAVSFNLQGDLSSYFTLSVQGAGVVSLTLPTAIPDQLIPANRLIVLEIQASAPQTVPAYATIVFEVIVADDQPSVPQLVFDATYYTGSYTAATGLTMNSPITLTEGYDASVVFALEGDQSQWFGIVQNGNSVSLVLSQSIPPAVLLTNSQLVFVITAQRLGTDTTRATIVISLTDEYTSDTVLGFDQVTYVGTVQNTIVTLDPITLIQGYTQAVSFNLQGDLSSYFTLSVQGAGVVSLTLPTAIPDQLIPANRLIVLEIQASAPQTVPAYATIVFEVIVADDQPSVPQLVFDATYYTGSYTAATGLTMNSPITLTEGYDASVVFALEGDQSQWFGIVQNGNSVSLVLSQSIPPAVLLTNSQLVFVITAQRLGTDTTRATIVISLTDEYTSDTVLGFDQVTYVGTVQNTIVTLDPITLIQGYTQAVSFNLQGDLSSYFTLSVQGAGVVSLTLPTAIPDQLIPANRLIVLEIQASAPQTVPAYATIVFEVIVADDQPSVPQLVFDATYYTGSYTAATGLTMNSPITLTEGYDASVVFALEGDQSQWFGIVQNGNSVSLVLSQSIPPAVLLTNSQLVFVITAQRLGTDTTRATIVISLTDEYTSDTVLGFDQVTYVGTVQNTIVTLDPITLIQGYTQAVSFNLQGDLSSYFTLSVQGAGVVSLTLPTAIPDQLIPANRLIVLEVQASAPQTVPAYATIVFEVIVADDQPSVPQLVFDATYYTGSYTAATGLTMNSPITLTEGYDASVVFALEGDQSQWFGIVQNGNSVSLVLSQSIPPAVLLTNSQLVFVITAQRLGTDTTRATIVISLTDEYTSDTVLGFDQVTYVGTVQNTIVTLDPITLIQGYTQAVSFNLQGDLSSYFTLSVQGAGVVSLTLPTAIPDQLIPANRLIVLEIQASAPQTVPAYATIVFEVIVADDQPSVPQLVFDATYYTGSYTAATGLTMNSPITLTEGYDASVVFALEGDQSQWFGIVQNGNSVSLVLSQSIPPAVLLTNSQLVFVITAQRLGTDTTRATIVISLTDEYTSDTVLGFDQVTYVGTVQNTIVTLDPITLIQGYTQAVSFNLQGDLSSYFTLSVQGAGVVSLTLPTAIPDQLIPANRLIVLEIQASAPQTVPAYATIVFEVIVADDQPSVPQLVFDATYYTGSYTAATGLTMNSPITLTEGYDASVVFALEGDQSQWFGIVQNGNSVSLVLSQSIPPAVLLTNSQLVFVITAQRLGTDTTRATIVISLTDEYTSDTVLGFDQVTYVGTVQNTIVTLDPITLIQGYTQAVSFNLQGDLSSYFTLSVQGAGVVSLTLPTAIPDQLIPANRLIVLEIQASAPQTVPAYATIVFEVIVADDQPSVPQLVFDATYYTGSYTAATGLTMNSPITLTEGYDASVVFALEGDQSQWFGIVQNGNSVSLVLSQSIPPAVLLTNSQLVFVITAQRLGTDTTRATIVISLTDEYTSDTVLGFDQVTYVGTVQNTIVTLDPITLIQGYTQAVFFNLQGDLSSYFTLSVQGAGVVSLTLPTAIPDQLIPANRLIVLEIQASAPQTVPAYATIVFEVIVADDQPSVPQLVFDATYYTGSYTAATGLTMNSPITLTEGYDASVVFALEGDQSQWFGIVQNGNSVSLVLSQSIPPAVLLTNSQLVFVITAQRLGTDTTRATIVISLTDEYTSDTVLGFDQVTYVGTVQNTIVTLDPITLIQGYTQAVSFNLQGDLSSYFTLSVQGAGVVSLTLPTAIPDQLIPANRLIVLEIQASAPQTVPAYATIVFEVIVADDQPSVPQLVFDATYYTGSYTAATGLTMNSPITLTEGYDASVVFALEGDQSQWFGIVQNGNSVSLVLSQSIPPAVLLTNSQLVFVITAQRLGTDTTRATIVISLTDEYTSDTVLGFDQVTYVGTVQNTIVTLDPITLIQGYTQAVSFNLQGDLSSYFTLSVQGAGVVSLTLPTAIPDQLIPANRLIVLEIQASAPQTVPAYATIVFEVIVADDQPSVPQLVFDATYYTGSYTAATGLTMNSPITLTEGYDASVVFALEGDQSQWFGIVQNGNSVSLVLSQSIPPAVLLTNSQLVFVITAQRLGTDTTRATIVISLTDEYTSDTVLGFDQVTYVGTVQNTIVTLDPITLIQGYTQAVSFNLQGDLSSYFTLSVQGAGVVSLTLPTAIPDQLIPANRLIVLEIQASAPQTVPAYATIVFEVIVADDQPSVPQLVFDATYYTGSYTAATGLTMNSPITLTEGYDASVVFALEGDQSQWFGIVQNGNSVSLVLSQSIPPAVLLTNSQLVFVITAQRLGTDTTRATIVISLTDEYTSDTVLGFDQVTYVGTVQNTIVTLDPITLIQGYTQAVSFNLQGDLSSYFTLSVQGAGVVSLTLPTAIPDQLIPANRLIVLEIQASAPQTVPAYATIVFEVIVADDQPSVPQLVFDATYYTGSYTAATGLTMNSPITLTEGYDASVVFALEGDQSQWFGIVQNGNSVSLVLSQSIPPAVLLTNSQLVFVITAQRLGTDTTRATIVISLTDEYTSDTVLGFDQVTYVGTVQNTIVTLDPITLIQGYTQAVSFNLQGDLSSYFTLSVQGAGVVSLTLPTAIPDQLIPANRLIVLEIQASAPQTVPAYATIVFEVIVADDQPSVSQLVFDATYYTGSYTAATGLTMNSPITLTEGYDASVVFALEGDHSQWFGIVQNGNSVSLVLSQSIPPAVLLTNSQLVFVITAQRLGTDSTRATIVISLTDDLQTGDDVSFEKLVYEGIIQLSTVQHETIVISNYNGVIVQLHGEYSSLFEASVADGVVTVQSSGSLTLPTDVTQVTLELHAADARAVLLLNRIQSDDPVLPSVSFSSPSYVLNVNIAQTGSVGRVQATADNGEAVVYSLALNDAHLQARLSISSEGELHLSAPANSGVYTFQVIATTVITQAEGSATVYLTVEAITVCGNDEIVVPPLIILERDEEEPHNNLVVLNGAEYAGCTFTLANRWPLNQNWLYVDENGLHARSIDREHESIAFMALSQVQVELILHCEGDNVVRSKRSQRTDWLGPYDYGTSKWILTESIPYNARRSLVNLVVNDINDNAPIFIGKEFEPIVVGYPVEDIEERILPRSLAELRATDADIGINAALQYSSSEDVLAVAPTTGLVHLRTGARLQDNQRLTVTATDQNGEGLSGHIQLMVKLLNLNNIAVVTVDDAFLHDEQTVLAQLSEAVGYEIKVLRSVVISSDLEQDAVSRKKRDTSPAGVSLQLYVYGLIQSEPVVVDRLATDINNNAAVVSIISTVSLEDHLEPVEIFITERDIGLLVATIVLSVLLFIIIVLIAIWFFLRWRKNRNYDEFTDVNSLASRAESAEQFPKPEGRPRLNIDELIRSERRLHDMLNAPIEEVTVETLSPRRAEPQEAVVDLSSEPVAPIVIQSIDKLKDSEDSEDEYGEQGEPRRKSVVTFNENVEKIIHVEDDLAEDNGSESGYEIYKL